jgi:hypothetical protein
MRRWLERFAKARGSVGGVAARLLEEARRKEKFPAVEFRDTPGGRVAFVHGTRVQMVFVRRLAREVDVGELARHYGWPLWKAESAAGYTREFASEIEDDEACLLADGDGLGTVLPGIERVSGA